MGQAQGHWFKCPKGHVYYIGNCGGPNEIGTCNECGNKIGGKKHRLLSSNKLAKDFDGATKPAYPTVLMAERRQELRVGENNSESDA
eukprot:TRINITY_DN2674_c0_g1_i2.p1 TRINITY_DN2674_c0_g1~~TRINITY_DN2674_c0_g1_i2.p1  ORF type:complete len:87 (+),score=16.70 TRINITY_DN2674_c0_g1_i2:307-567(+)